ncbi:MAG: helix-turn-helix transcriptional regulator [Lachnospiraceae bacterium]|nr:helix-turn-helix transcriptional regulator [Lachnospiraceae bacterium]
MTIGKRIKEIRKEKSLSVEYVAKELGVSPSTLYRYENSSIEKVPVHIFDKLCEVLDTSPAVLMGNETMSESEHIVAEKTALPRAFEDAQEAMEFMLRLPTLAAFGGYDPDSMDEETIVEFANEILQQLALVSYKYKK